jgi:uncharacterized protein YegJ (DUF2314 family)
MAGRTLGGGRGLVRRTLEAVGLRAIIDRLGGWPERLGGQAEPLPLAADDPLLAAATRRARQTLPELRRLRLSQAGAAAVKFAFTTDGGETENVWAEVLALHADDVVARIVSRPVTQRAKPPARLRVAIGEIADWQVTLPDGTVRGGFSSLAMLEACRRDGRPIPRALRNVRFLDGEEREPAMAGSAAS